MTKKRRLKLVEPLVPENEQGTLRRSQDTESKKESRFREVNTPGRYRDIEVGSIEQQLDMCESGPLRGDEIQYSHGILTSEERPNQSLDTLLDRNFQVDMSEENREGAEEAGDEHSSGLQGDEEDDLQIEPHTGFSDAGLSRDSTEFDLELEEELDREMTTHPRRHRKTS